MKTVERVQELTQELVAQLGYELVEVEFAKEAAGWVLTLYIDSPSGITLDDCEQVSRAVDPVLDEADPIEQAYYLSVSSLGLDRPIKKDRDFQRNVGKSVTVKLYAPVEKKKEFTGKLMDFNDTAFTLVLEDGAQITFERRDAALIRPYISFE